MSTRLGGWLPSVPQSVRGRAILAFSALVAVLAAFVSLHVPRAIERQALTATRERASSLAAMAAYTAAAGLYFNDYAALAETAGTLRADPAVVYVAIVDRSGTTVYASGAPLPRDVATAPAGVDAARTVYHAFSAVVFRGRHIGDVHVGLSLDALNAAVVRSRMSAAFISLAILLIGLVWVVAISALLTRPVSEMAAAAHAVAEGDLDRRARPARGGELRQLALAFNSMVDRLQAAQQGLEASNRRLEEGVRQRTLELQQEVEERRRAEVALRESEARFRSVFEVSVNGIAIFDSDGRIVESNPALDRMWHARPQGLLGLELSALFTGTSGPDVRALLAGLAAGSQQEARIEARARTLDGTPGTRHVSLCSVPDAAGGFAFGFALIEDTTEQRELEQRLVQSQKMEAVGRLAGGIAHDFNNLLTVINGSAILARESTGPDHAVAADLEHILHAGERAAGLTRQLLAFGRRQVLQAKVVNVNGVVAETSAMLRRLIGEHIRLELALAPDLPPVLADVGQLAQVLMNLVVNARDAMPAGGAISIETGITEVGDELALRLGTQHVGPHVQLRVRDTGVGMDEATRRVVFEPFFTTKPTGKGTGLGLATVYGIVRQSEGAITVESAPGQGTTFTVLLPAATTAEASRASAPAPVAPEAGTSATVLLVEDEEPVRRLLARVLTRHGFTVLEACNGVDALRVAGACTGTIDLLLTDVIMPEMGGPDLVARLSELRPEIRVVYMSGYTASEVLPPAGQGHVGFIPKPSSPREIVTVLREVLGSAAPAARA